MGFQVVVTSIDSFMDDVVFVRYFEVYVEYDVLHTGVISYR